MANPSIHFGNGGRSPVYRMLCLVILVFTSLAVSAQFAPVVGFAGTTAIAGDSSAIVAWATGCTVHRGYRDIAVPDSGYASNGDSSAAIGPAGQDGTVSLGDGGSATLTFASPIMNGPGFDFAIFENGFDVGAPGSGLAFLELAFVEVSTDGVRYVRFQSSDNVQDTLQFSNASGMDGSKLNNLAGKYIYDYGTPFDLDELKDSIGLDVNNINYVRVVDVVGSINAIYATHDSRGYIINDPYPTNFPSSGFDLDAVGVINQKGATGSLSLINDSIQIYPNPTNDMLHIHSGNATVSTIRISDVNGKEILSQVFQEGAVVSLTDIAPGIYTVRVINQQSVFSKLIVKE